MGGLIVTLEGRNPGTVFEVNAEVDGEQVAFRCNASDPIPAPQGVSYMCLVDGFILQKPGNTDLAVAQLTVTETASGRRFSGELRPTYTEFRPNGPDCEPLCRQATETVTLAGP